ncbi:cell division protein SepF [Streptomyces lydicus]|uniref:cell division protein SepF n=1 Tax=Streptomyces lydicus TaxID=47763 RepID=UPI0037B6264C
MGSVRKASAWLGLVDDSDDERYYDDDYAEGPGAGDTGGSSPWVTDPRVRVADETAQDQGTRIATVTPESFRDARGIGELFRDGVPVIVNLTAMEPADAKRVVDFAAGLTFGLRGSIERVATRVFLLTPADYKVLSGESRDHRNGGFFNQS